MEATPVGTAPFSAAARWGPSASPGRRRSSLSLPFPPQQYSIPQRQVYIPGCSAVQMYVVLFLASYLFVRKELKGHARVLFVVVGPRCYQQQFDPISLVNLFFYVLVFKAVIVIISDWSAGVTFKVTSCSLLQFSFSTFIHFLPVILFLHFKRRIYRSPNQ
jgi:hypothetical protein